MCFRGNLFLSLCEDHDDAFKWLGAVENINNQQVSRLYFQISQPGTGAELLLYCLASRARLYYCPACNASKVTGSHKLHTRNSEPQLQPAAPQSPRIQRPWDASFIDFRNSVGFT